MSRRSSTPDNNFNDKEKLAVISASKYVVALQSCIDGLHSRSCSGIIIFSERNINTNNFVTTIVTSANLVRHLNGSPSVSPNLKIQASLKEQVMNDDVQLVMTMTDFHYNLAIVNFNSTKSLPAAPLNSIYEPSLVVPLSGPTSGGAFLRRHTQGLHFNIQHNDKVLCLGRFPICGSPTFQRGSFCVRSLPLDFEELYFTTCQISQVFVGGPLINMNGEVIGINFRCGGSASFLPANILSRFCHNVKNVGDVHRPLHGMRIISLGEIGISLLEILYQKHITGGVFVEEVKQGSPAQLAGICPTDVIVMCAGDGIKSSMEFHEKMWDHMGECVEMGVIQGGEFRQLTMTIAIADVDLDSDRCSKLDRLELKKVNC